jgi:hypothetical protein
VFDSLRGRRRQNDQIIVSWGWNDSKRVKDQLPSTSADFFDLVDDIPVAFVQTLLGGIFQVPLFPGIYRTVYCRKAVPPTRSYGNRRPRTSKSNSDVDHDLQPKVRA